MSNFKKYHAEGFEVTAIEVDDGTLYVTATPNGIAMVLAPTVEIIEGEVTS